LLPTADTKKYLHRLFSKTADTCPQKKKCASFKNAYKLFQQSSVACLSLLLQQPGGAASLEYKYMVISIEPKTKKAK
jgi:hypothetical protein